MWANKADIFAGIKFPVNGYMATVTNLKSPSNKWRCGAAPITVNFQHLQLEPVTSLASILANRIKPVTFDLFFNFQAMLSVKHDGNGSRAMTIGKPFVHPATVDLRGKVYEYVTSNKLILTK